MSSRLIRGQAVATEPVPWRRVSSLDSLSAESSGESPASYILEPGSTPGPNTADVEQRAAAAREQGFEEGQAAGRHSRTGEMEAMRIQLGRAIEELTGLRPRYRGEAEQDVVALALAMARRILHRELTVAPEALLGLVKAALDKLGAREVHRVRVARVDGPMIRQFFEQIGPPQQVEVIADGNLPPGSVLIESGHGTLDASVDTQLAEIERGFADLVRGVS